MAEKIATQGNISALNFTSPLGVALALFSTLLWASYWILNTKNTADPTSLIARLFGFTAIFYRLEFAFWRLQSVPWQGVAAVTYVGLFEMGITFVFMAQCSTINP